MIKVFNSTDTTFSTNGNVVLEPTYANVHKEDNGEYYLDIETNLQNEVIKHIEAQAGTNVEINSSATLTDVDTTKEAELTALKGQTSQASTPTPSTPQPINVVTGEQDINVIGKNLIDYTLWEQGNFYASGASIGQDVASQNVIRSIGYITIQPSTTYTLSCNEVIGQFGYVYRDTSNTLSGGFYDVSNKYVTFTTPNNVNQVRLRIGNSSYQKTYGTDYNIQLEANNQATTYEPYTGNTYEINLGKNLFDEIYTSINTNLSYKSIFVGEGIFTLSTTTPRNTGNNANLFFLEGKVTSGASTSTNGVYVDRPISRSSANGYVTIAYRNADNVTPQDYETQLERGSTPTQYSSYKTPIELDKIGTYQDKIYKDNGKWYLHKEIGKVVLDGSNYPLYGDGGSSNDYWEYSRTGMTGGIGSQASVLTNYFNQTTNSRIVILSNGGMYFRFPKNAGIDVSTNTLLNTWLSTHNTTVYYVLATPTDTPIEDSELLEQLESIELLNGLNNISFTSPYLPALLDLHYNYVTGGDVTTGDYLQPNNILVANTPTGNQAFRITSIEKTRHKIKIKANHVFYDSMNYVIQDSYVVDKNLNDALDHLNNATDNTSPFTTLSNVTTINSYRCVRKSLYEAVNVLLERWGGHLVRDNFNLKIMDAIGQDNGVTVRYGKNLKDITVDYNWDNVVTKILPVGYDGLLLDEIYIYADIQYDVPYTKVVHFEQDLDINDYKDEDGNVDEEAYQNALKADLRSQAHEYLQQNSIPKVNYELQANLEKITDVGDVIEVIDERLGVNIMTSLISYDYDCILEKYTTLEFGNFQKKLNDLTSYIETQSSEVATEISNETKVTLQTELAQATSQLWGVLGNSYVIYEGDKILVVDSLPKESATNVLMINSGGIGFSNTGINGTFSSAWTIDNVLNMENINVINLSANLIRGGTLKLGSNINQNGILEVYDEANNLIAQLTKDGLRMNATDGGYLLINTTVGFSGYDRNDNRIYWVDGDEFHMKKSVVEEEITLVDKMRIIPITITENNVIVNDGIGFVSTL